MFSLKAHVYIFLSSMQKKSFKSHTIDLKNPAPVEVGSLSHHLQGFIHPWWLFRIFEPSMTVSQYWSQKNISTVKLLLFPKARSEDRREIGTPVVAMLFLFFLLPLRSPKKWSERNRRCFFNPPVQAPLSRWWEKTTQKMIKEGWCSPKTLRKWMMLTNFCPDGAKHGEQKI